jgi:hypothetical protein
MSKDIAQIFNQRGKHFLRELAQRYYQVSNFEPSLDTSSIRTNIFPKKSLLLEFPNVPKPQGISQADFYIQSEKCFNGKFETGFLTGEKPTEYLALMANYGDLSRAFALNFKGNTSYLFQENSQFGWDTTNSQNTTVRDNSLGLDLVWRELDDEFANKLYWQTIEKAGLSEKELSKLIGLTNREGIRNPVSITNFDRKLWGNPEVIAQIKFGIKAKENIPPVGNYLLEVGKLPSDFSYTTGKIIFPRINVAFSNIFLGNDSKRAFGELSRNEISLTNRVLNYLFAPKPQFVAASDKSD